jgi:hypothetical protein
MYRPVDEEKITKYREILYPNWLKKCEDKLRNLHKILQVETGVPSFCFIAKNSGMRPAFSTLVTIEAFGNLKIAPPARDDENNSENEPCTVSLPRPPIVPKGHWELQDQSSFRAMSRLFKNTELPSTPFEHYMVNRPNIADFTPSPRDPNGFYYKPSQPILAAPHFQLECEQWRHGVDPEAFHGEIHVSGTEEKISGSLEFRIHAENLSETASLRVPVRITYKQRSTIEQAKTLVEALFKSTAD